MIRPAPPRVALAAALCLLTGLLVAGCGATARGESAAGRKPLRCDSKSVKVDVVPAQQGIIGGGDFDLRFRNVGRASCVQAAPPYVFLDSGYGPGPAIDGTAYPDDNLNKAVVMPPGGTLRLLVSWSTGCEPNHVAPIKTVKVRLASTQPELSLPASRLPHDVIPTYCWNNGVELGPDTR